MRDRLSVNPDAMAKDSAGIGELADEVRAIHRWFDRSTEALGTCWGEGDAVARSFEENYTPAREQFGSFLTALTTAFEKTEEAMVDSAKSLASDDQFGADTAMRLGEGLRNGGAGGRP